MYDLLNQYRRIGRRKLQVIELKKMLGIADKYKQYGHFKDRVISPAVEEVNERSDLLVTYKEIKEGILLPTLVTGWHVFIINKHSNSLNFSMTELGSGLGCKACNRLHTELNAANGRLGSLVRFVNHTGTIHQVARMGRRQRP